MNNDQPYAFVNVMYHIQINLAVDIILQPLIYAIFSYTLFGILT